MAGDRIQLEVFDCFGSFVLKQNLCDDLRWQDLRSSVQQRSRPSQSGCLTSPTERLNEDLNQLIKTLQGILGKVQSSTHRATSRPGTVPPPEVCQPDKTSWEQVTSEAPGDTTDKDSTVKQGSSLAAEAHHSNPQGEKRALSGTLEEGEEESTGQAHPSSQPPKDISLVNDNTDCEALVQIRASKAEIDRRIAAFIERKRQEVDEGNRREFCTVLSSDQVTDSCARTDAVFLPRPDSKSHVKVSRVVNQYGPQTRNHMSPGRGRSTMSETVQGQKSPGQEQVPDALEERLDNMEKHVNLEYGPQQRKSIYERLKALEERILLLESTSPEYFGQVPNAKRRCFPDQAEGFSISADDEAMDLAEINDRISSLKKTLGIR